MAFLFRANALAWRIGARRGAVSAAAAAALWGISSRGGASASCEPPRAASPPAAVHVGAVQPGQLVASEQLVVSELVRGTGDSEAAEGMIVSVHCRVRVAATGLEVERTRDSSGSGNRNFGEPLVFVLGDPNSGFIGAVHVATVGMRAGGKREVRLAFQDPDFGYQLYPMDEQGRQIVLHPWSEIIIEVELEEIRPLKPEAAPTGLSAYLHSCADFFRVSISAR
mmetsp:Transcript_50030/g.117216  ORF Transcript_50030/g.117216 Transcript_50030/m.117216 type:complete len:224 (-) Transcript_50030:248-919(-)